MGGRLETNDEKKRKIDHRPDQVSARKTPDSSSAANQRRPDDYWHFLGWIIACLLLLPIFYFDHDSGSSLLSTLIDLRVLGLGTNAGHDIPV